MTRFDPAGFTRFDYTSVAVQAATGTISCAYRLTGPTATIDFRERFVVGPVTPEVWDGARGRALRRIARLLWLAAGLSYFKTAAPAIVAVPTALSAAEQAWLLALYREGLGEFAYKNNVDLSARPQLDVPSRPAATPISGLGLPRRSLVPVGGGKDSCVTIDVLRAAGDDLVLFNIGAHRAARDVAAACELPLVVAHRALDPQLRELNRRGALNGHVPVTAIVSLVAVAQALIIGADQVVFSNERSANVGSFTHNGLPVNHQYSKGVAAERSLRGALGEVTDELVYFSLLRPLSELHVAELFAGLEQFLPVFTSCNAAFRLDVRRRTGRWCGHCPKCRFVFLALAPFLPRERLVEIFGLDLLADPTQLDGYRELLGLRGHKPFECVGDIQESQVALQQVVSAGQWQASWLLAQLHHEVQAAGLEPSDTTTREVFTPSDQHFLPTRAAQALQAAMKRSQLSGTV
jgi:hypothetical protein